eukprot:1069858-Amphidinium_carterae.2
MIFASGEIDACLLMDEVFAPEYFRDTLDAIDCQESLHYLTEVQFAMIRRTLRDQREGLTDVNKLTYWKKFQGRTAKQNLATEPEIVAATGKLMTVVQEGKGKKRFAVPKGVRISDVVSRVTYDMDNFNLISTEYWNPYEKKRSKPSPPGVSNIHTIFTYQSQVNTDDVKRLPPKLSDKMVKLLEGVVIPLARQRTNVWDPLKPTLRSVNLGAFNRRGCGVTKQTSEWPEVVSCLHRVAKFRPKSMRLPYTSISLNQLLTLSIHKDSRNSHLPSRVVAFKLVTTRERNNFG